MYRIFWVIFLSALAAITIWLIYQIVTYIVDDIKDRIDEAKEKNQNS